MRRVNGTYVGIKRGVDGNLLVSGKVGVGARVRADNELSQHLVLNWVNGVLDDAENVETRQDGFGELHVLLERNGRVVPSSDRVGSGDNGAARLEGGDDTGL